QIDVLCPLRVNSSSPVEASHTLAIPPQLPATIRWPSGEKAIDQMLPLSPFRESSPSQLPASLILVLPLPPITNRRPSGEKATDLTAQSSAVKVNNSWPEAASHIVALLFQKSPVTIRLPSGEKATDPTPVPWFLSTWIARWVCRCQ